MNAVEFVARLSRDLKTDTAGNLSAVMLQEVQDATNASLQLIHDIAPVHSKKTRIAVSFNPPKSITIGVTNGSNAFTGWTPDDEDAHCSIQIDGDAAINEIVGEASLLLPYAGATGTVAATVWNDAAAVPSQYAEIIFPLVSQEKSRLDLNVGPPVRDKHAATPEWCWMDDNASSQLPWASAIICLNSLPSGLLRYTCEAIMAPIRINLRDLLDKTANIPMRGEHIESRLLPMVRGRLAGSEIWRNDKTRDKAITDGDAAIASYSLTPQYQSTPSNRVGTPHGF